jgi:circadian clock protein KaiC
MLGGGLVPGSNTLLLGPSGIGKTTTAVRCMLTALERGQRAYYYLFDEGLGTFVTRCRALGMELQPHLDSGRLTVQQVDPAAMSPGEFANGVLKQVLENDCSFVVIDSLNAYLLAMPGQGFLLLHMHELLNFLNQQGVMTMLVVGQHGFIGEMRSEIDLSYLSDSILIYRFFEVRGEVRSAISAVKNRTGPNQRSIREFRLSSRHGLRVGAALQGFEGVLGGLATYRGETPMLGDAMG